MKTSVITLKGFKFEAIQSVFGDRIHYFFTMPIGKKDYSTEGSLRSIAFTAETYARSINRKRLVHNKPDAKATEIATLISDDPGMKPLNLGRFYEKDGTEIILVIDGQGRFYTLDEEKFPEFPMFLTEYASFADTIRHTGMFSNQKDFDTSLIVRATDQGPMIVNFIEYLKKDTGWGYISKKTGTVKSFDDALAARLLVAASGWNVTNMKGKGLFSALEKITADPIELSKWMSEMTSLGNSNPVFNATPILLGWASLLSHKNRNAILSNVKVNNGTMSGYLKDVPRTYNGISVAVDIFQTPSSCHMAKILKQALHKTKAKKEAQCQLENA